MLVNDHGLLDAAEVKAKGRKVKVGIAMQIANAAHLFIEQEGRRSITSTRCLNLHDGWPYIYEKVAQWLPTQSHALVAVAEGAQPYGEVLVGHERNVHIDTLFRAPQWINLFEERPGAATYWIVDLAA